MYAVREIYTERAVPPRWPRLVREAAQEWLPEGDVPDTGGAPDTNGAPDRNGAPNTGDHLENQEPLIEADDELFVLGERCAQAYMQADAIHYQAMRLLAEFDRLEGWKDTGFGSTAEWLAWRIGIKAGSARERLRTALALSQLPETSDAMRKGEL